MNNDEAVKRLLTAYIIDITKFISSVPLYAEAMNGKTVRDIIIWLKDSDDRLRELYDYLLDNGRIQISDAPAIHHIRDLFNALTEVPEQ